MASYPGSYRHRISAGSPDDNAATSGYLRRWSKALNIPHLAQLGHLAPRYRSAFIDYTNPEDILGEIIMAVPEEDMLEAKDPDIKDTDEWPSFNLRKVNVVSMGNGQIVSLLDAHQDNPVKAYHSPRADMVEVADFALPVKDPKYKTKTVEIMNVTNYAFAEYDDGSFGFWAAGKAGWFEIKSASGPYSQTLLEMNEAASMFYTIADKTRRGRKNPSKMSEKDLVKYTAALAKDWILSEQNYLGRDGPSEVQEGFNDHRCFLITSMLEGQELGSDWAKAPMLSYFKYKFSDDFAEIEARVSNFGAGGGQVMDSPLTDTITCSSNTPRGEELNPHTPVKPSAGETDTSEDDGDGENEADDDGPIRPIGRGHKRKSILQPKGSKFSKKAAGSRNSLRIARNPDNNDDGDEDDEIMEDASPLATASTNTRNGYLPPPGPKPADAPYHEYLPDAYIELKLVQYDLPTAVPQGPGDLWTCEFKGCMKRVYEGSTEEGREQIKQHFKEHEESAKEKIDLVRSEGRPYLPVDNLVRRLQVFAPGTVPIPPPRTLPEKAAAANPEKVFPKPIRRGY